MKSMKQEIPHLSCENGNNSLQLIDPACSSRYRFDYVYDIKRSDVMHNVLIIHAYETNE